jgi:hypothetical protein
MPGACVSQVSEVDAVKQPLARAKQDWRDDEMHFIDQSLPEVLPNGRRSAYDSHILSVGGVASPLERGANPVSDEMKGRASLHHERRARMMCEHENGRVVNRVLAPPSSPALVRPGTANRPKHVSAHNPGANVVEAARGEVVVNPGLAVFASEQLCSKRASRERPGVKGGSADSKRVLQALIRARPKAVNRDGVAFHAEFSHLVPFVAALRKGRSEPPLAWVYESGLANFCQR